MAQTSNRWLVRNRKIRCENDYNRVMNEYIGFKYAAIKQEVDIFYSNLRDKYPDKPSYKGSKAFRTWVLREIKNYVEGNTASGEAETVVLVEGFAPAVIDEEQQRQLRGDTMNELVNHGDAGTASGEAETVVLVEGFAPAVIDEEQQRQLRGDTMNELVNHGDAGTDVLSELIGQAGIAEKQPSFGMPLDGDVLELNQMDKLVNELIQDLEMDLFQVEDIVENDPPVDWW